jgi:hypothetical protein
MPSPYKGKKYGKGVTKHAFPALLLESTSKTPHSDSTENGSTGLSGASRKTQGEKCVGSGISKARKANARNMHEDEMDEKKRTVLSFFLQQHNTNSNPDDGSLDSASINRKRCRPTIETRESEEDFQTPSSQTPSHLSSISILNEKVKDYPHTWNSISGDVELVSYLDSDDSESRQKVQPALKWDENC